MAENAQGAHGFGNVTRVVDGDERGVGEQLDVRRRERTYRLLHDGECDVLLVVREEERGRVVHESQQGLERRRLRERGRGVEQWELVRRIRRRLTIQRRQTVGVLRLFAQKKDVSRRRGGQLYVGEKGQRVDGRRGFCCCVRRRVQKTLVLLQEID